MNPVIRRIPYPSFRWCRCRRACSPIAVRNYRAGRNDAAEGLQEATRRSFGSARDPWTHEEAGAVASDQPPYAARGLMIPSLLINDCSVVRFIPSRAAAKCLAGLCGDHLDVPVHRAGEAVHEETD